MSYLRSADDVEIINRSSIHIAEVAKQDLYDKNNSDQGYRHGAKGH